MSRITLLTAGLVAILAFAASSGAMGGATRLTGTTGPGFTITLKKAGVKVKMLKAGSYTITVNDKSKAHDFRLRGPGLNKLITGLAFKGTKTVTVTLKKGIYTYLCDPHVAQGMRGTVRVT
jgi:Copper binding proteins, plastocyanin/azurin family